ncbi:MAG: hypothetical protein LUF27_14585 [Lachnospiraceae bacterium]|nr:hypothetical protein [Lachnospiraceae bacterium]
MLDLSRFNDYYIVKVTCMSVIEYFHDPEARVKTEWRRLNKNESNTDWSMSFVAQKEAFAAGDNGYSKCIERITDFAIDVMQDAFHFEDHFDTEWKPKKDESKFQNIKISVNNAPISGDYITVHRYMDQQMHECSADCPDACIVIDGWFSIAINAVPVCEKELMDLYETTGLLKDTYNITIKGSFMDPVNLNEAFQYERINTDFDEPVFEDPEMFPFS